MAADWPKRVQSAVVTSGTGKSHFCEALGQAAIEAGLRVAWFSLESLTATIARARVDASVPKV
ncbi:MAG TPA: ATP-binding protein, partial [Candidatus Dormibacteraeota bacterium]|nr:ATP-binding protein [Candidatus Dormibacteraeota bacterium]